MRTLPTVLVEGDDGPVRINERDYDEEKHKLIDSDAPKKTETAETTEGVDADGVEWNKEFHSNGKVKKDEDGKWRLKRGVDAEKYAEYVTEQTAPPAEKTLTTSEDLTVTEIDGKFFITESDGAIAVIDTENEQTGYATDVDGWNALSTFKTSD